jgi:UPF0716 protein FxsA
MLKELPVRYLLLLFIVMPVLEMWLLITVGSEIGALLTIGLVLLTAFVGAALLREQGFATLWRGRQKLQEGKLPAKEMGEAIILAVSGALLLTPGFVTDVIGFAGLIPPIRALLVSRILSKMIVTGSPVGGFQAGGFANQNVDQAENSGNVIDGESWERKDLD